LGDISTASQSASENTGISTIRTSETATLSVEITIASRFSLLTVMAGRYPRSLKSHLPWIGSSVATLLDSELILVLAISLEPIDARYVRQSFSWSPALDAIKYRYETFANIDFFTESPYFGLVPTQ
jgi:hypothetical protein